MLSVADEVRWLIPLGKPSSLTDVMPETAQVLAWIRGVMVLMRPLLLVLCISFYKRQRHGAIRV